MKITATFFCFALYLCQLHQPVIAQDRLAYRPEGFSQVNSIVSGRFGNNLQYKLYLPNLSHEKTPLVFFVNGVGSNVTDWGQYIDWPKAVAAAGLIGLAYEAERENPEASTEALFRLVSSGQLHSSIDTSRVVLWACSSNGVVAMRLLMNKNYRNIKGASLYYPVIDYKGPLRRDIKVELVRAGLDGLQLNEKIDNWIPVALKADLDVSVINFPGGRHAFDMFDEALPQTATIIKNTIQFLRELAYGDIRASNPDVTPQQLLALLQEGNVAEAERLYTSLKDPSQLSKEDKFYNGLYNANSLNRMSTLLIEDKKYEAALVPQQWALRADPKHPNTHDNIAEVYLKLGDKAKALQHAKLAIEYLQSFQHPNQKFIEAIRTSAMEKIKNIEGSK